MRQTLYVLTSMAMDLVKQLRRASLLQTAGQQVDFTASVDLARKLRNELNDRFLIVRSEKENENNTKHTVPDLIHMVKILERETTALCTRAYKPAEDYEHYRNRHQVIPDLTERIANQLRNIHSVMGEFRRACGQLQDPSNNANARKDGPAK
ncbi:hypothetical protein COOONC_10113 [Cooperia oncophora]